VLAALDDELDVRGFFQGPELSSFYWDSSDLDFLPILLRIAGLAIFDPRQSEANTNWNQIKLKLLNAFWESGPNYDRVLTWLYPAQ